MDSNAIAFVASVAIFLLLCRVLRAHLTGFSLSCAVVLTPLAHLDLMPQNTFGIPGISLVNVIVLVAAVSVLQSTGIPEAVSNLGRYFTWPMIVFGLLFSVAVLRTGLDVGTLLPRVPEMRPTAFRVLALDGLLSAKYLIVGFLVALYGIHHRTLGPIEKAMLTLPIVLCPVVVSYFLAGALHPEEGVPAQKLGRDSVSGSLGIHANYLGRMALYLLLFALTAEQSTWRRVRWLSIASTVVLIELSFSRTIWLVGPLLVVVALRGRPRREWLGVAACVALATAAFFPYVAHRTKFGFEPKPRELREAARSPEQEPPDAIGRTFNRVMAGRTGNIWPTVLPNFFAHPVFGQGLYSVWKPVDPEARRLVYDHPHNAYLEVALDMGVVGLAALGWMLGSFWQISRSYRPFRYLLVAWVITAITGDSFYPHQQNALNWIVLGMACAAAALSEKMPSYSTQEGRHVHRR